MFKRKREKDDVETAEGAKHKKVKEHPEKNGKREDRKLTVETVPKSTDDASLAASVGSPSKASKRRETKLGRKDEKELGSSRANSQNGFLAVTTIAKATERPRSALEADPSNKALRRREAKIEKRRKRGQHAESLRNENLGGFDASTETTVNVSLGGSRSRKKHHKGYKEKSSMWEVSEATGGHMLDLEPVFPQDEAYILLAYDSAIHVYSTSTSLLVRKLRINRKDSITAFSISPINTSHLYLSTRSGIIQNWDWIEGVKLESWNTSSPIYSIEASNPSVVNGSDGLIYTIDRKGQGPWMITAHRLVGGADAAKTDLGTLRKYPKPLTSLKVYENGRVIIATSGPILMIGSIEKTDGVPLRGLSYIWRDVDCPEWITSVDVQIKHSEHSLKRAKLAKSTPQGAVNVVVGGLKGSIFIYDDLLKKLKDAERHPILDKAANVTSQRMHWHRNAVLSVKWSADGNYIISGGLETVLQIWQLETGQKQALPHLSAPIESIVVSPSGSSYGIRLADNSAMILSTSELQPTFSVSGIQIPAARNASFSLPHLPTVDAPSKDSIQPQTLRFPATVGPTGPGRLLLAVPSSSTSRQLLSSEHSAVYLQTFDITSSQQLSRQALARTNVTDVNIGPESNVIQEPNVTFMQISSDGQWLATVDEWMPPRRDLTILTFDKEGAATEQISRLEIYLKFWSWNDESKSWELVSRIDNPHTSQPDSSSGHGTVDDLAADPSSVGFATIGDDAIVRIWKPSLRSRNGLQVRGKDGKGLVSWRCRHASALQSLESATVIQSGGKIAYSSDGSMLAVGYQLSLSSVIQIFDTDDGMLRWVKTNMYNGPLIGLGITDRYLITLSHELRIFDLVMEELSFGFALDQHGLSLGKQRTMTHLAVDHQNRTFAVALPELGHKSTGNPKMKAQVTIFDPANPIPLYSTSLPNTIISLLPAKGKQGYHAIDSAAEIRTLTCRQSLAMNLMNVADVDQAPSRGIQDMYGNGTTIESKPNDTSDDDDEPVTPKLLSSSDVTLALPEGDAVVVSRDRLAEVFDIGPAHALPPITELFEQVASLFTRKPTS